MSDNGAIEQVILFHGADPATVPSVMVVNEFSQDLETTEDLENGNLLVRGLRIFREGTFADSKGDVRTWSGAHLDQMVQNFHELRSTGIFTNVPVRADHTRSVKDVIGWFHEVYRDPRDRRFLSCDIEFTTAEACDKWKRRTFRSRSSEIGLYRTNDGATYFPTVCGLAFVDVGAVEGLYEKAPFTDFTYSHAIVDTQGDTMNLAEWLKANPGKTEADWAAACNYAQWLVAANYAKALEDHAEQAKALGVTPAAPAPAPASNPLDALNHQQQPAPGAPVPPAPAPVQTLTFAINGEMINVSDFSRIQAHIHTLETFRDETIKGGRHQYVNQLCTGNAATGEGPKMPATQKDATIAFVDTLSDSQFLAFRAQWDAAPAHALFGAYAGDGNDAPGAPGAPAFGGGGAATEDPDEVALAIIAQHRLSGKDDEFIKNTSSYKILANHNKAPF